MVDIHSHILPFLDDGPDSLEESLAMASLAVDSGISHMAATSHGNIYSYTLSEYRESFALLQEELQKHKIPLKLYPGMEIFMDAHTSLLLQKEELLTINGTDYLLVEFPFEEQEVVVFRHIANLQKMKYHIVIAHPERYLFMQKNPELAYILGEKECILQVNQGSVLGEFGDRCRKLALRMMDDGIVKVIASDAHGMRYRSSSVQSLLKFLKERYTPMEIHLWLSENPSRILKGYPTIESVKR